MDDYAILQRHGKDLTLEDHIKRVKEILQALREANLLVHPDKSEILAERISLLGHVISAKGIEIDQSKVKKIQE